MTPEIRKYLRFAIAEINTAVSDLEVKKQIAVYLLKETDAAGTNPDGAGLPGMPTSFVSRFASLSETLTIIEYLQTAEKLAKIKF